MKCEDFDNFLTQKVSNVSEPVQSPFTDALLMQNDEKDV